MDAERHALLARRLVDACGGVLSAAESCRLKKSQLARFGDPESGQFMPADIIAALERRAGAPIYSLAIAEACEALQPSADLRTEAMLATEEAVAIQAEVREATSHGTPTPTERRRIKRRVQELREQLRELDATLDGEGACA